MRIAVAQLNSRVGALPGNSAAIRAAIVQARAAGAAVLLTPELSICGYPPEDLLLQEDFVAACEAEVTALATSSGDLAVVVGTPLRQGDRRYNAAVVLRRGRIEAIYRKQCLPDDSVFDETRYFSAGDAPCVFDVAGVSCAVVVCEDAWNAGPVRQAVDAGARVILVPNASPFHVRQRAARAAAMGGRAKECGIPLVYVNRVGGQDELVFDGASFVVDAAGAIVQQFPAWHEVLGLAHFDDATPRPVRGGVSGDVESNVYAALVMAVRDYTRATGFEGVLLGLSGGIDSALALAIAVDALGRDAVHAVMMPSPYTAPMSVEDARTMAGAHGVRYDERPIAAALDALREAVEGDDHQLTADIVTENLQARIRGTLLMALSNRDRKLVLTTGNKSELAVGYATLYGDMAGGFAVLKDVDKTLVYQLARWRNRQGTVIPQRVIDRPPSAELRHGQIDQDTLPPYDVLDAIVTRYVEDGESVADLLAGGLPPDAIRDVVARIHHNEFKRRQSPVGPRITPRAFGKDWRYPIASAWTPLSTRATAVPTRAHRVSSPQADDEPREES